MSSKSISATLLQLIINFSKVGLQLVCIICILFASNKEINPEINAYKLTINLLI